MPSSYRPALPPLRSAGARCACSALRGTRFTHHRVFVIVRVTYPSAAFSAAVEMIARVFLSGSERIPKRFRLYSRHRITGAAQIAGKSEPETVRRFPYFAYFSKRLSCFHIRPPAYFVVAEDCPAHSVFQKLSLTGTDSCCRIYYGL